MLHQRSQVKDLLPRFDWIGLVLYSGGLLVFLMGLAWGGTLYPWKSGYVMGTVIGGGLIFTIFILWEIYLPLGSTEPFLPLHLFKNIRYMACAWLTKNIRYMACAWLTAVGAATYYGFSLIWPSAVGVLYTDLSDDRRGTLVGLVVYGFVFGQILGGFVATFTGPKPGIVVCMTIAAPLLMAVAADPLNMELTMGLITTGSLFIGAMEGIAICTTSFPLRTQEEIGTAGGLSGAIWAFGSVLAVAIYAITLTSRLTTTIPANVVPAAEQAGLPASSIPALISGLGGRTSLNSTVVPGITPQILAVASQAYRVANAQAYKTVFLASFAFGGLGMIICWFVRQLSP